MANAKHRMARSALSNGRLLRGINVSRSTWARRMRDLLDDHVADLGGEEAVSTAELSIIRRASVIIACLERFEERFAQQFERIGDIDREDFTLYCTASEVATRLLKTVGIKRVAKDVTPAAALQRLQNWQGGHDGTA